MRSLRVPKARLCRLVEFVARREGQRLASVDLAVVGAGEIAGLNRQWLSHAGQTDVLSFDLSDDASQGLALQLVVCGDVAAREGELRGHGPQRELMLYVVHGLLHAMGYEDLTIRGGARMHAREDELLADFGAGPTYQPAFSPRRARRTRREEEE